MQVEQESTALAHCSAHISLKVARCGVILANDDRRCTHDASFFTLENQQGSDAQRTRTHYISHHITYSLYERIQFAHTIRSTTISSSQAIFGNNVRGVSPASFSSLGGNEQPTGTTEASGPAAADTLAEG